MTDTLKLAERMEPSERLYLLATPLQMHADPCVIARKTGATNGHTFAGFARRYKQLFDRIPGANGVWNYRLSPLGVEVAAALRSREG